MSLFSNGSKSSRQPTERSVIKSVIIDLWVDESRKKINWSFSRVNPENERGFRTLKPDNVPECVTALAALGRVFSAFPGLNAAQQTYFAALAEELDAVIERLAPLDAPLPNAEGSGLLALAQK